VDALFFTKVNREKLNVEEPEANYEYVYSILNSFGNKFRTSSFKNCARNVRPRGGVSDRWRSEPQA
jgi:hypothetical protein